MPHADIYFIAPLANVDSSILKLKLKHNFLIKDISISDYCDFISKIERITPKAVSKYLIHNFPTLLDCSRQKIYLIENSFKYKTNKNPIINDGNLSTEQNNVIVNQVQNYLQPTIQKMRLFKEGNICIPLYYIYSLGDDAPYNLMTYSLSLSKNISPEKYVIISDQELSELYEFINYIKIPFSKHFLQLAFDNFELSFQTQNQNLAFLSLIISLESLFNPGEQELRYRISRNTAVLLGSKGKSDSKKIYADIRNFYDARSKLVHKAENPKISRNDFLKLRDYVRESIKMINKIDKDKPKLLPLLNSSGFNEKLLEK